jgi:hypothetical protein
LRNFFLQTYWDFSYEDWYHHSLNNKQFNFWIWRKSSWEKICQKMTENKSCSSNLNTFQKKIFTLTMKNKRILKSKTIFDFWTHYLNPSHIPPLCSVWALSAWLFTMHPKTLPYHIYTSLILIFPYSQKLSKTKIYYRWQIAYIWWFHHLIWVILHYIVFIYEQLNLSTILSLESFLLHSINWKKCFRLL